mgnify:CR=1 FL=1
MSFVVSGPVYMLVVQPEAEVPAGPVGPAAMPIQEGNVDVLLLQVEILDVKAMTALKMGALLGMKAFSAAVLGGIGNLAGAMLGGVLLGIVEALGAGYIGDLTDLCRIDWISTALAQRCAVDEHVVLFGSNYQDVFAFVVLILVLVFRPSGLLGERVGDRA